MALSIDIKEVRASYGRCIAEADFFDRFYDRFLASHPAIREKFKETDFAKQKELIKHGVNMMIGFYEHNPIAKNVLDRIRESHKKSKLDIEPILYNYWLESLMATISENDKKLTDEVAEAWRQVLKTGIDHITSGYLEKSA